MDCPSLSSSDQSLTVTDNNYDPPSPSKNGCYIPVSGTPMPLFQLSPCRPTSKQITPQLFLLRRSSSTSASKMDLLVEACQTCPLIIPLLLFHYFQIYTFVNRMSFAYNARVLFHSLCSNRISTVTPTIRSYLTIIMPHHYKLPRKLSFFASNERQHNQAPKEHFD